MSHQHNQYPISPAEAEPLLSSSSRASIDSESTTYQTFLRAPPGEAPGNLAASVASVKSKAVVPISWSAATVLFISLGVAIFLQAANVSLLTTTQGVIAEDLDAYESTSWFTSAHLMAFSAVSPVVGKLAYIISPRMLLLLATVIFGIGSLISGFAPSLPVFLLGRVVSGIGAAGKMNIGIVLVLRLCDAKNRGLYNGILNSGYTTGVALGATVAGALEAIIGWRALFWGQAPIELIIGVLLFLSIPSQFDDEIVIDEETGIMSKLAQIDYIGALLLIGTVVSLLYGLSAPEVNWIPIAVSAFAFPVFLFQEMYRHPDPIIPVTILESRGALFSAFAILFFMIARWAVLFFTPVFAIAVRGWTPAAAGSLLLPTNIGFAAGSVLTGMFHIRRHGSFYIPCLVIFGIFPFSLFALERVANAHSPTWVIVFFVFINGFCAGAGLNYNFHHVLHLVLPEVRFVITALLNTFRGFSGTFGSAIGGGIFLRVLRRHLEDGFAGDGLGENERLIRRLLGSPRVVQNLRGAEKEVAIEAYTSAIGTLFLTGVGLSVLTFILQAIAGWEAPVRQDRSLSRSDSGNGNEN